VKEGRVDLWQQFTATVNDNIPLFLCFLVIMPVMAWDAVKFANRVVGPLTRIRRTMSEVASNEPVQLVQLRKDDFLTDTQHDLNLMLLSLEQRGAIQLQNKDEVAVDSRSN